MERRAFLERVRVATQSARLPAASASPPGALADDLGVVDVVERFTERVEAINGDVSRIATENALDVIANIMESYGASEFLAWVDSQLPVSGIGAGLISRGYSPHRGEVPATAADRIVHQAGYFDLRVGITGCDAGLAESGTIVLSHGHGRPRMASLVPLVHVALLPASKIVESISHWAVNAGATAADTANLVMISGPSRTGDIEMVLTLGVHGPKHVHVLVFDDC